MAGRCLPVDINPATVISPIMRLRLYLSCVAFGRVSPVQEGLLAPMQEHVLPVLESGRRHAVLAAQFGGSYVRAKKFHNDSRLVLRVASFAHVLPPASSSKKHSSLIGLTLADHYLDLALVPC